MKLLWAIFFTATASVSFAATNFTAATAINALGTDLLRKIGNPRQNVLLSPVSIESALAMAYTGAAGQTREEMAKVLHLPADDSAVFASFANFKAKLEKQAKVRFPNERIILPDNQTNAEAAGEQTILNVANQLFAQTGYQFRPKFTADAARYFQAPFSPIDFQRDPRDAAQQINTWVEQQTHDRIRNIVSPNSIEKSTRLVLVNAMYFKAPWFEPFLVAATQPEPFHVGVGAEIKIPTMVKSDKLGYVKEKTFQVVTIPYSATGLQFVVLLPNDQNGLAALESTIDGSTLAKYAHLRETQVALRLPKFKMEPPAIDLSKALEDLGMKSAFDHPKGTANFDGIAPRNGEDYLHISKVLHKGFIEVEEKGTEAAAATAIMVATEGSIHNPGPPVQFKVDHPFLFAIQERATGACLFLGHVVDPR